VLLSVMPFTGAIGAWMMKTVQAHTAKEQAQYAQVNEYFASLRMRANKWEKIVRIVLLHCRLVVLLKQRLLPCELLLRFAGRLVPLISEFFFSLLKLAGCGQNPSNSMCWHVANPASILWSLKQKQMELTVQKLMVLVSASLCWFSFHHVIASCATPPCSSFAHLCRVLYFKMRVFYLIQCHKKCLTVLWLALISSIYCRWFGNVVWFCACY
jgi:hypothetical protein